MTYRPSWKRAYKEPSDNKYKSEAVSRGKLNFDSKSEAACYDYLHECKELGKIRDFLLQPPFRFPDGTKYVADFLVFFNGDRECEFIDCKGFETDKFRGDCKRLDYWHPTLILRIVKDARELMEAIEFYDQKKQTPGP